MKWGIRLVSLVLVAFHMGSAVGRGHLPMMALVKYWSDRNAFSGPVMVP